MSPFIMQFWEALFRYSSFFDMFGDNILQETHKMLLLEKQDLVGKQWMPLHVKLPSGFRPDIYISSCRLDDWNSSACYEWGHQEDQRWQDIRACYNFAIDQDGQWLLQGWIREIVHFHPGNQLTELVQSQISCLSSNPRAVLLRIYLLSEAEVLVYVPIVSTITMNPMFVFVNIPLLLLQGRM